MVGIISCQSSVSVVLVRVTKLLAMKTDLMKGKLNRAWANGEKVTLKEVENAAYAAALSEARKLEKEEAARNAKNEFE